MIGNNIFLSDAEKSQYQSDLANLQSIWGRPLLIYRQAERVVISENLNYNFAYGDTQPQSSTTSYIINSGIFNARIWYLDGMAANKSLLSTSNSDREFTARGEPQIRFRNDKNYVRLKLECSGYNFILGAKTVEIDTNNFNIFSAYQRIGLFTPEFWAVWLEESS
jgi:hypothetical protein